MPTTTRTNSLGPSPSGRRNAAPPRPGGLRGAATALLLAICAGASGHSVHGQASSPPEILAPGYQALNYPAPAAGSYALPPLEDAADGEAKDVNSHPVTLHGLFEGRIVVLSFVYTRCDDVNGCPLATYVLSLLQERMAADPEIDRKVRLITMSFDPANDTPATLRQYAAAFGGHSDRWQFLTTTSENQLRPILRAYHQTVQADPDGAAFSHILRVFLIDRAKRIRNIYSVSFLHVDTLINDIKTLLLETAHTTPALAKPQTPTSDNHGSGEDGLDYDRAQQRTPSQSAGYQAPRSADLMQFLTRVPRGLPAVTEMNGAVPTSEQVALGRKLFYDRRLSHNNTISCAMCHIAAQGFTNNEIATAIGIEGRTVKRNAPTLYNIAYMRRLFHDAREYRLEHQAWGPLLAKNEMGNPSIGYVINEIDALPDYAGMFQDAFGGSAPTMETVGAALAAYERTLVSGNSPFDRWHYGQSQDAIDAPAKRGYEIFVGKGNCVTCHHVDKESALFTDQLLHNTGIGYDRSMKKPAVKRRVQLAPGIFVDMDADAVADSSEPPPNDLGRYEITEDPADRWRYRTPTLRNVSLTAPYMHDGSIATLEEVVRFYNRGGIPNELLDPLIKPLNMSERELADLVAFLNTLTGDNVETIVGDATSAPIGDPR